MEQGKNFEVGINQSDVPQTSRLITQEDFLLQTSLSSERLEELMTIGWLKAKQKTETTLLFLPSDVLKVRKLERICLDFEVEALPAAIIVDLLERVETLENEVAKLKQSKA